MCVKVNVFNGYGKHKETSGRDHYGQQVGLADDGACFGGTD